LGAGEDDIDRQLRQLSSSSEVDSELEKMKAELGAGSPKSAGELGAGSGSGAGAGPGSGSAEGAEQGQAS
jgi:phage shock protein A